jgi:hypothetical protein
MTEENLDIIANDSTFSRTLQVPVPSHLPDLIVCAADRWRMTPTEFLRSAICERYCVVQGDSVTLTDENGEPLKDGMAKIGDASPRSIASIMVRRRWEGLRGATDFDRPIPQRKPGWR